MPHPFTVTSQDESDRGLGLCHVCFSTLLSNIKASAQDSLKIRERNVTKSGGDSSYKRRGNAGTKFLERSTDVISIESNRWNEGSVN